MQIDFCFQEKVFVAQCTYFQKDIPKAAGFLWDKDRRRWYTPDFRNAKKLETYLNNKAKEAVQVLADLRQNSIRNSAAVDADIKILAPEGLDYLPYQKAGVAFASSRDGVLIGDEMGLGKTIQAIGVINKNPIIREVLIVCPASLKLNWKREIKKWLVRDLSIGVGESSCFPETDIVIINYDIVSKHAERIARTRWGLLICDEAHYIKNQKAQRSKACYAIQAQKKIFLTGTPIVNRPAELFPLIHNLDPKNWPSWFHYVKRYCNGGQDSYGRWDVSGASNLDELHESLRASVMVRRLKKDVLKELPPKTRQIIEFEPTGAEKKIINEELTIWNQKDEHIKKLKQRAAILRKTKHLNEAEYKSAVMEMRSQMNAAFSDLARMRHDIALRKLPRVIDFLKEIFESDPERKVVIFAHHRDVIEQIRAAFFTDSVSLMGGDKIEDRQAAVDRFQTDPNCRLFIGSIMAAGVGITLTAAAHVVFAELDWVPGNISQAEDRCHRIGQSESVLIQHLVLENSLDAEIAKRIIQKQTVIDAALDGKKLESDDGSDLEEEDVI